MKTKIVVVGLFPELVQNYLKHGVLSRIEKSELLSVEYCQLRDYSTNKYGSVDSKVYGGGPGQLIRADVLEAAIVDVQAKHQDYQSKVFYCSPRGIRMKQAFFEQSYGYVQADSNDKLFIIVCGRYEGVDQRFIDRYVDLEVSLGDFVLTGGELAAMAFVDAFSRFFPGVLGNAASSESESFSSNQALLGESQYTQPANFAEGVPEVLLSGHHDNIDRWRLNERLMITMAYRPELIVDLKCGDFPKWSHELIERLQKKLNHKA